MIISPSAFQVIEEGLNNNAQWVDPYKPEEQLQNIPLKNMFKNKFLLEGIFIQTKVDRFETQL